MGKTNRKRSLGNSDKLFLSKGKHHKDGAGNGNKTRGVKTKMQLCNFESMRPTKLPFTPTNGKLKLKVFLNLKNNEECIISPCDKFLKYREDLFTIASERRKGLRPTYITFDEVRPSLPGRGSENAFFITIINMHTGYGTTYKIGVMNVVPDSMDTVVTYFVKSLITEHSLCDVEGKGKPHIQSFVDVEIADWLERLPHKKVKFANLPNKYTKFHPKLPKRPHAAHTARNVFFDPFEGAGVAVTSGNALCTYGIKYLESKCADIFPIFGAVFKDFFAVPLAQLVAPGITHIAVRAKTHGVLKEKRQSKYKATYNSEKLDQLFKNHGTQYPLYENEAVRQVLASLQSILT